MDWFSAPEAAELSGTELFAGTDATVLEFWRFAMSDLRMNNVRGYLAEFLVARAVSATGSRIEWDAYDVLSPEGIKIEVKSSAHLQVWDQRAPSRIVFTGLRGRLWSPQEGEAPEATYNADVYVFAVHAAMTHDEYDPLDTGQWEFYVLPLATVTELNQKSIGEVTLRRLAGPSVDYRGLRAAILRAAGIASAGDGCA